MQAQPTYTTTSIQAQPSCLSVSIQVQPSCTSTSVQVEPPPPPPRTFSEVQTLDPRRYMNTDVQTDKIFPDHDPVRVGKSQKAVVSAVSQDHTVPFANLIPFRARRKTVVCLPWSSILPTTPHRTLRIPLISTSVLKYRHVLRCPLPDQ